MNSKKTVIMVMLLIISASTYSQEPAKKEEILNYKAHSVFYISTGNGIA